MRRIENVIEFILFQSRWLLAPFYLGLVVSLILLFVHFLEQLAGFVVKIHLTSESEVILGVLSLVDLVLVGNLLLIVIFSGYENFVSRLDTGSHDRPDWMTKIDFGGLKQKLMSSIVAISAIQVLKAFMNVSNFRQHQARLARRHSWLVFDFHAGRRALRPHRRAYRASQRKPQIPPLIFPQKKPAVRMSATRPVRRLPHVFGLAPENFSDSRPVRSLKR